MEKLQVKKITLDADGILKVETNIKDNLELAKYVNKDRMEKCLNDHPLEMHIYQQSGTISSLSYMGRFVVFDAKDLIEFLQSKAIKTDC